MSQPHHAGRHFLQIPGPTNVPDRVLRAIDNATIDHRGPAFGRMVIFALPAAWLVGSAAGRLLGREAALPALAATLTILLGALVAADRSLPLPWAVSLAIALGLLHGAWNGIELARAGTGGLANALGVACAIFVLAALLAGFVCSLRVPWSRIVVRVAGSWIAAAALFMLGWSLRAA